MKTLLASFAVLALLALVLWLPSPASALPLVYSVSLSGAAENPANVSSGIGTATVTIDLAVHSLSLDVSFTGLSGTTTAAHIHCCVAAPGNAGVASQTPTFVGFPLGVTSGTYQHTFDLDDAASWNAAFITSQGGIAQAESALAAGLASGSAYLNIHTTAFGAGEIRGFVVPEPSTALLLGMGLCGIPLATRRRPRGAVA